MPGRRCASSPRAPPDWPTCATGARAGPRDRRTAADRPGSSRRWLPSAPRRTARERIGWPPRGWSCPYLFQLRSVALDEASLVVRSDQPLDACGVNRNRERRGMLAELAARHPQPHVNLPPGMFEQPLALGLGRLLDPDALRGNFLAATFFYVL